MHAAPRVRNKAVAKEQITAEQMLREATDRQEEKTQAPMQRFADLEELHEFQGRKRREFEDYVRRNRLNMRNWTQYAQWELEQKEFRRARSIFERALDVDSTNVALWLRYIEAEMKNTNVSHARNLLDRAVTILPRNDKLWYKYVYMEETLGNFSGARSVFERWMSWKPDANAWHAYIKLETRHGEIDHAREIFRRFALVHPDSPNWIKWARFEEAHGTLDNARTVFLDAFQTIGEDLVDERLFMAFARLEAEHGEDERVRYIYKQGLDHLPRNKATLLHAAYTRFEKQHGTTDTLEAAVLSRRRVHYEKEVKEFPKDYDVWLTYAWLEEDYGDFDTTCEIYERAIAHVPPSREKRHWRKYIYVFLFYAVYCEMNKANHVDIDRARAVWRKALETVPHRHFTFAKLWVQAAHFEVRQLDLAKARKIFGHAIGLCPKDKIFREYLIAERKLYEFQRCRIIHEKRLAYDQTNSAAWIDWAQLEASLNDNPRAKAIFEMGLEEEVLDKPERLWKAYIEYTEAEGTADETRALYERLLAKTSHFKVWNTYAQFELGDDAESEDADAIAASVGRARQVFERANARLKEEGASEHRAELMNAWQVFEEENGSEEAKASIKQKMPQKTKKWREGETGLEEYSEWAFPEDQESNANLNSLLQKAQEWKKEQEEPKEDEEPSF